MTQKRNSSSFMIEDILGHLGAKTPGSHSERTTDSSDKCPHTISNNIPSYCALPERHSGAHPFEFGQQTSQFPPPVSPYEPSSPGTFPSRFAGYPPPFLPVSPPLASSSRDILAFFPNDFSERYLTTSQESFMRSSMFSASAVLDLSNYVHKPCRTRAMHQAISSMPSSAVEASRQIIWKHIPRNPAKRKGGQIRFTSEQTATLESTFSEHKYLSSNERKRLAAGLKLSERQVKTWFQNRRAKWRRIKQEPMGHISSPESDDSDHQIDESCKLEHSCCHGNRHSQLESLEPMKTPRC